jgi:type I restriction enzyme S subunit
MNQTLEAMAQVLFKSSFVDFDPVRAKAEGRTPAGMDAETESLFSDSFENSVLGEIPRGWRIGKLNDIADIAMGQSPPGDTYNDAGEGLPFYQGIRDFGFRFPSRRIFCTAPTRLAETNDVLLSVRASVGALERRTRSARHRSRSGGPACDGRA